MLPDPPSVFVMADIPPLRACLKRPDHRTRMTRMTRIGRILADKWTKEKGIHHRGTEGTEEIQRKRESGKVRKRESGNMTCQFPGSAGILPALLILLCHLAFFG